MFSKGASMTQLNGRTAAAYCIVILCCAFYLVRGYHAERILLHSNDFKTIYGASRSLLTGGDPYDSEQAYKVYVAAGGALGTYPAFREHEVLYLPPAIALVSPFALLRWHPADRLWLGLTAGIFMLGTLLIVSLCLPLAPLTSGVAMGLMLVGNTMPVMLAQPEQLSSGFCTIAMWCFLQQRNRIAGVACMAVALVFQPHAVGLVWLFFFVCKEYRSRAIQVAVAALAFSAPGLRWLSVSMLPLYHREYDVDLLVVMFPGFASWPPAGNGGAGRHPR